MGDNRIAMLFADLGYGSTFSSNVILFLFEQLQIYPSNAANKITTQEIAVCLAMMAKTHTGLDGNPTLKPLLAPLLDEPSVRMMESMKTWNLELFFTLIKKMVYLICL
jgi:hypothetical protein